MSISFQKLCIISLQGRKFQTIYWTSPSLEQGKILFKKKTCLLSKDRLFPSRMALSNSVSKNIFFYSPFAKKNLLGLRCFSKGIHFPSLYGSWKKGVVKDWTLEEKIFFLKSGNFQKYFFGKVFHFHFKTFIWTV